MAPQVMGIVNVAPDSSGGGRSTDPGNAIALGRRLAAEGADLLDVSSAPRSGKVDAETESERVLPVVEALSREIPVCIGTTRTEIAEAAVALGATAISDQSLQLHELAAQKGVGWIAVHRPGRRAAGLETADAVAQSISELTNAARGATASGVPRIWIDPGIGFDREPDQSLGLLANIGELVATGYPVLVSASRKRFLGPDREATLAATTWGLSEGAAMVRVHDVQAAVQARAVVSGHPLEMMAR